MKQCPTCSKEFPDSMRFCQTDGTLLVEKVEDVDPYKTVVGNQDDIAAAIPPLDPFKTMVAPPPKKDDEDILDLPNEPDMLKTMVVSPVELKSEAENEKKEDSAPYAPSAPLIEPKPPVGAKPNFEPVAETPVSTPPDFGNVPASSEPTVEKKDVFSTPPIESKPFGNDFTSQSPYGNQDSKPIPSPFDLSMPPGYMPPPMSPFEDPKPTPTASPFDEPKSSNPPFQQNFEEPKPSASPFDAPTPFGNDNPFNQNQPLQQSEWNAPPAPDANWQNQPGGLNSPNLPPVPGQSLNQTLPIVSLILGIVSLCCYISPVTGIAALITGYLGMKNANTNPNEYGGKTLAIVGMVLGGLFLIAGILYWLYVIFVIGFAAMGGFR